MPELVPWLDLTRQCIPTDLVDMEMLALPRLRLASTVLRLPPVVLQAWLRLLHHQNQEAAVVVEKWLGWHLSSPAALPQQKDRTDLL